jgi:hypothetical protein
MTTDAMFQEIKERLEDIQGKTELGIPLKKFEDEIGDIKRGLLVKWIRHKRRQKHSYKQIEEILNGEGVPTLSGKGKWNSQTICNMVKAR